MSTTWTIRALMDWTENHFQQKGLETPRLEAQLLLAHALNCRLCPSGRPSKPHPEGRPLVHSAAPPRVPFPDGNHGEFRG